MQLQNATNIFHGYIIVSTKFNGLNSTYFSNYYNVYKLWNDNTQYKHSCQLSRLHKALKHATRQWSKQLLVPHVHDECRQYMNSGNQLNILVQSPIGDSTDFGDSTTMAVESPNRTFRRFYWSQIILWHIWTKFYKYNKITVIITSI